MQGVGEWEPEQPEAWASCRPGWLLASARLPQLKMRWTGLLPPWSLSSSPAPGQGTSLHAQSRRAGSSWRQLSFSCHGSSQGHGDGSKILQTRVLDQAWDQKSSQLLQMLGKKKRQKKKLYFPKPVKRCSGSFHPPPLPQLALGSIQVVERKTGTLKRKWAFFSLLFFGVEKSEILRETFMWFLFLWISRERI